MTAMGSVPERTRRGGGRSTRPRCLGGGIPSGFDRLDLSERLLIATFTAISILVPSARMRGRCWPSPTPTRRGGWKRSGPTAFSTRKPSVSSTIWSPLRLRSAKRPSRLSVLSTRSGSGSRRPPESTLGRRPASPRSARIRFSVTSCWRFPTRRSIRARRTTPWSPKSLACGFTRARPWRRRTDCPSEPSAWSTPSLVG